MTNTFQQSTTKKGRAATAYLNSCRGSRSLFQAHASPVVQALGFHLLNSFGFLQYHGRESRGRGFRESSMHRHPYTLQPPCACSSENHARSSGPVIPIPSVCAEGCFGACLSCARRLRHQLSGLLI